MGTWLSEDNLGQFRQLEGRCLLLATASEMPARSCQFRIILDIVLGCGSFSEVKLSPEIAQQLVANGVRLTKQREEVFGILLQKRDHPTAAELFLRAKKHMPSISLATIYNCLDALVDCDLVKQVNVDRAATRYCANLKDHSHFHCESCGSIADVEKPFGD